MVQTKGSLVVELCTSEIRYEAAPAEKVRNSRNIALVRLARKVLAVKRRIFLSSVLSEPSRRVERD